MNGPWAAAVNGLRELWANRMRSLLSMSGIILGVTALASMLAVAEGMLDSFHGFVEAQGGVERIAITRAPLPKEQEHLAPTTRGLTLKDADSIVNAAPLAEYVSPELEMPGETLIERGDRRVNARVTGCTPAYLGANRRRVTAGRFIADLDLQDRSRICVIGVSAAEALFPPNESPVGQAVKIDGRRFVVAGVLDRVEGGKEGGRISSLSRWKNQTVCIPLQTAMTRMTGDDRITGVTVRVGDGDIVQEIGGQLETVMLTSHRGLRDFRIETNEETIANFRKTERTFVNSLGGVALVALLVGGAGIMNVMLASINERTREIGVRLALGAHGSDIFIQFLLESTVVGAFGGVLGLAGAFALLAGIESFISGAMPDPTGVHLSQGVMLLGVGFSCTIGLLAGVYPALRASRLNPIDALRSE